MNKKRFIIPLFMSFIFLFGLLSVSYDMSVNAAVTLQSTDKHGMDGSSKPGWATYANGLRYADWPILKTSAPQKNIFGISAAWNNATIVDIDGWVTGASNYISIYTTATARHSGIYDATEYVLSNGSSSNTLLTITEENVRIEGIQLAKSGSYSTGVLINATGTCDIRISYSIIKHNNSHTGVAFAQKNGSGTTKIWNTIFYNCANLNGYLVRFQDSFSGLQSGV